MTDMSMFECLVVGVRHSDANVHPVGHICRLLDIDITVLEWAPGDEIERIRVEWERESGFSPKGVVWCPRWILVISRPASAVHTLFAFFCSGVYNVEFLVCLML